MVIGERHPNVITVLIPVERDVCPDIIAFLSDTCHREIVNPRRNIKGVIDGVHQDFALGDDVVREVRTLFFGHKFGLGYLLRGGEGLSPCFQRCIRFLTCFIAIVWRLLFHAPSSGADSC